MSQTFYSSFVIVPRKVSTLICITKHHPYRLLTSFLSTYYRHSVDPEIFFKPYIAQHLGNLWSLVCEYKDDKHVTIIECILKFGANLNLQILDWIAENYNYVRTHKNALGSSRIQFFNKTVKFSELDSEDKGLITLITKANAYVINSHNLSIVLSVAYNDSSISADSLSFDLIRHCPFETVRENLLSEDSLKSTYASLSGKVKNESIESIDYILKSSLDLDDKRNYLIGQLIKRDNLNELSKDEQKLAIECNILNPTWRNIDNAYTIFQNQENLISNFINNNIEALSKVNSAAGIENEVPLYDLLFGSNTILSIDGYGCLIGAFECVCEGDQYLSELNSERFEILLTNGKIPFDSENLEIINETEFLSRYIIYNRTSFLNHLDWDYSFSTPLLLQLLQTHIFTQKEKNQILEKAGISLILASSKLASISSGVIADNLPNTKFNIAEIRSIVANSDNIEANIRLVTYLFQSEALDEDDISQILQSLKDEKFVQLSERHKQPKFDRVPVYTNLLLALKNKHFISSISGNDEIIRPNYYKPR